MPRGDRTGPWGSGPMTGRAAGYCAGYPVPGFVNPTPGFGRGWRRGLGRGFGRGWGRGFGRGWWWYTTQYQRPYPPIMYSPVPPRHPYAYPPVAQPPSPEQEVASLENYKKDLEAEKADLEKEMNEIESRIEELKKTIEQGKKPQSGP